MTNLGRKLDDTLAIEHFMRSFGQNVRDTPTTDVSDKDRVLRGRLVIEEALELLQALGLRFAVGDAEPRLVDPKDFNITVDEDTPVDLVEVADALADLVVVVKGTASTYGVPVDEITLAEVMPSNMSKLDADGNPIHDPVTGKVVKSDQFFQPDIAKYLVAGGWDENETV